ncbi:CHRD domain-containing protein [Hymenobacter volaticus]|uniref:CHRD domain-containing protein n=1 Tax=Hymenobacter volaticus TaxID=2932254 RepID=A0ABY4GB10_9BACT|nr:CHRD domain-containing protein [Hymenobacter volaticus]UOQ67942.1 CHRD domain-containing protein [Hymenobacter volaticus]
MPPVTTNALGLGTFNLTQAQDKLKFRVVVAGLSGPITMSHFHQGAPGVAGPVVLDLMPYISGNVIEGEVTPTPAIVAAMKAGQIYINVHTAANPGGEIRGQLFQETRFISHDARLDAAQLVPAGTATGKGVAVLQLNSTFDTLRVRVAHTGLSAAPTTINAYAKGVGQANTPADLIASVNLTGAPSVFGVIFTPPTGSSTLGTELINLFLTGGVNLVFTTAANPNGEIRGRYTGWHVRAIPFQ